MPWRFADLAVASAVALPDLPETGAEPDITIVRGSIPALDWMPVQTWRPDDGPAWLAIDRAGSSYRLTFPELVCVVSADGARIAIDADGSAPDTAHLLLHQVLPLAVSRLGRFVLHACAVETPHGAVALIGDSGVGKSTLAAAFCSRGFPLVADDALVVDLDDDQVRTWPTADGLRLWADAMPAARVLQPAAVAPSGRKHRVPAPLAAVPSDLARIVLIGDTSLSGITLNPEDAAAARMAILPHVFRLDVTDTAESRAIFDAVHALARRVAVRRAVYPNGLELLDGMVDAILDDLRHR